MRTIFKHKNFWRWAVSLIILLLFGWLVWSRIDLTLVATTLYQADVMLVVLAIVPINGLAIVFNSVKWRLLLRYYEIFYPFLRVLHLYLVGMFAGFFLSDSLGAFSKVFYVRRDGYSGSAAAVTIVLDKLTELAVFLASGMLALYAAPVLITDNLKMWGWITGTILLVVVGVWIIIKYWQYALTKLSELYRLYLNQSLNKLQLPLSGGKSGKNQSYSIKPTAWLQIALLSLVSQFFQYIAVYLLMLALGISLSFGLALVIIITVGLISMLPISPAGIGTRDAALVFWFNILDIPVEYALALSILLLLLYIFWRTAGLVGYLLDPLDVDAFRQTT